MLRNCPRLVLILCVVIGLGTVAVAEQNAAGGADKGAPDKSAPDKSAPGKGAAETAPAETAPSGATAPSKVDPGAGDPGPEGQTEQDRGGNGRENGGLKGPKVGRTVDGNRLHRVSRPGLYGMSQPPAGSAYGIVDDRLIRFDPESGRILSIIRQVDGILD